MKFLPYSNSLQRYKFKKRINKVKLFEILFVIIFLSIFSGVLFEKIADHKITTAYKSKYKFSSVDSNKIAYGTSGQGKYTFVLESDIGTTSLEWSKVSKNLPKDLRALYYDRFGYGVSDGVDKSLTIEAQSKALHTILKKSGLKSPYILVGNSYGALLMADFAKTYPEEVGGLILINPPTKAEMESEATKKELKKEKSSKSFQGFFSSFGVLRLMDKLNLYKQPEVFMKELSGDNKEFFNSKRVTSNYLKAVEKELENLKPIQLGFMQQDNMKDKPLVIITTKNKLKNEELENRRIEELNLMAGLSKEGQVEIIEEDNNLPLYQSDFLINTFKNTVKKVMRIYEK